jgi:hypothetical protein
MKAPCDRDRRRFETDRRARRNTRPHPASIATADFAHYAVEISGERIPAGRLAVFRPVDPVTVGGDAGETARLVLIGGETLDGPRHLWQNFVSSRRERVEQTKADWKAGCFSGRAGGRGRIHPAAGGRGGRVLPVIADADPPLRSKPRAFRLDSGPRCTRQSIRSFLIRFFLLRAVDAAGPV